MLMANKKPLSADRFKQICAEVAEHQGIDSDSELCQHIATLRLVREQQTMAAIAGRHVNPEHLLRLDEAMRQYLPPPKKPMAITVKFVGGQDEAPSDTAAVDGLVACRRCRWVPFDKDRVTRCYRCGWTHGADTAAPWSPVIEPAASYATINDRGHMTPASAPAGTPSPQNVVSIDDQRAQRSAELRDEALRNNHHALKRNQPSNYSPNIGAPYLGNDNRSV
jgi:hypothetical protein